jgi:uncharacterized protein related to proFAR isomerase
VIILDVSSVGIQEPIRIEFLRLRKLLRIVDNVEEVGHDGGARRKEDLAAVEGDVSLEPI